MTRRHTLVLALLLLGAGTAIVLVGIFKSFTEPAPVNPLFTATPLTAYGSPTPHPTEPLLPPPPTSTGVPSPTGTAIEPTATRPQAPEPSATEPEVPSTTQPPAAPSPSSTQPAPTASPTPTPTTTPTRRAPPELSAKEVRARMGVGATGHRIDSRLASELGVGWYVDWRAGLGRFQSEEIEYVPTIRLNGGTVTPSGEALLEVIDALPGALWLIGNEPDVEWQDNSTPAEYAEAYHELYHLLKERDPTCRVAIGGVTQPTPLRMRYLDAVLSIYLSRYGEPMPIDVWNVHNFVLREERDSWGVGIPPGFTQNTGTLREIADHDDLGLFEEQIIAFRQWMADKGFQDKPLIVSEYGILMPADYGFPPDKVAQFMVGTFQLFSELADPKVGYPEDDYRLVQRWCWYSLADDFYAAGSLVDPVSGNLTTVGEAYSRFARQTH